MALYLNREFSEEESDGGGDGSLVVNMDGSDASSGPPREDLRPADPLNCQVDCWACTTRVQVPVVDGQLAPEFKCGWCGAISSRALPRKPQHHAHHAGFCPKFCSVITKPLERLLDSKCCGAVCWAMNWVVVVFVLGLITSIITISVLYVLPRLQWQLFHGVMAIIFSTNIYFNYYLTVQQSPGSPQEIPGFMSLKRRSIQAHEAQAEAAGEDTSAREKVPQASFDNYTYCRHCEDLKPPQAHHCRVCKRCVLEMDHHCPFVNNCVGASNLRPFMLFLFWASVACAYSCVAAVYCVWANSQHLIAAAQSSRAVHGGSGPFGSLMAGFLEILVDAVFNRDRAWILFAFFVIVVSFAVFIGVGILFVMQFRQLLAGVSYIDTLKHGRDGVPEHSRMQNLQKVFGTGHPLTWLLPRSTLPKGAATLLNVVKKGE